ncbi:hypothetical protein ANCCAN_16769 [Ancylostoma caninum]|uniref:Uncharacterized protein n=1 Tax=Ancylostoma caninum TaxID=29170 RepID=A0A368G2Y5_ANCCA|nr:hypothetical protein ANCCAN_16769 [Ancylostoma caninum]
MNQIKLETAGAYVPTPAPAENRSNRPEADTPGSTSSSGGIPLNEIERVLPIYLRVYFKENGKVSNSGRCDVISMIFHSFISRIFITQANNVNNY